MKDFYDVSGLTAGLDDQAYADKYAELKAKYSEDMFLSGEEGNNAAKKLTELESVYSQFVAMRQREKASSEFGTSFAQIDILIRDGKFDEAQTSLDAIMARNAEWHYYQSVVFYMREWMNESRKHLVIACQLEPSNVKYRETLQKLDMKMANPNVPPQQFGAFVPENERGCGGNSLSNCCLAYCCADCCCSMTQCC